MSLLNVMPEQEKAAKIILIGDSGTGKTDSLVSAIKAGFKVRVLSAENNSAQVIFKAAQRLNLSEEEISRLGVSIPDRPKKTIADLLAQEKSSLEKTLDREKTDPNRKSYTRFIEILTQAGDFKDSISGDSFGSCYDWGNDTIFAIDSLTIICYALKQHYLGGKLSISQPEWGILQSRLMEFLYMMTENLKCHLVLMAHPSREQDPNLGVTRIYPISLGVALNNSIPGAFTESVWSYKDKGKYYWSTDDALCVTRHTYFPCKKDIPQDYGLLNLPGAKK